jgi:hypothetical protein
MERENRDPPRHAGKLGGIEQGEQWREKSLLVRMPEKTW